VYFVFVQKGAAGSEDILIEALDKAGNKNMAETFLNCGNFRLEQAAREWGSKHGYKIESASSGLGRTRWGSAR
jgi:hypothetical protein